MKPRARKKKPTRLDLNRETLRNLNPRQLQGVQGGWGWSGGGGGTESNCWSATVCVLDLACD